MKIEDMLSKSLYKNSFDGDTEHYYIKFKNMGVIINEQSDASKDFAMRFYEYMDDNYKRIGDGYVTRMSIGKSSPIITIDAALEGYENNN